MNEYTNKRKNNQSPKDTAQHENSPHRYWTQMLNMAEDDLGPYEYRLLAHYVRWASEGGKPEGNRTTAKLCKMSPPKVIESRQKLIDAGYIQYKAPSPKQAAQGIGGVVLVLDRWSENMARYSRTPAQKIEQVYPLPASNIEQVPALNIEHSEEPKEELKNTVRKERARDPIFDLVTRYAFEGSTVETARIGKVSAWFKGSQKIAGVQPIPTPATAEQVEAFYRWYKDTYPKLSVVQDAGKTAGYWVKFIAQAARRDAAKPQRKTFE